jgi:hypothetical protein
MVLLVGDDHEDEAPRNRTWRELLARVTTLCRAERIAWARATDALGRDPNFDEFWSEYQRVLAERNGETK